MSRKWLFGTGCSAEVGMFMVLMLSEVSEEHSVHKEGGGFPSQAAGLVSVPKVCSFQAWGTVGGLTTSLTPFHADSSPSKSSCICRT